MHSGKLFCHETVYNSASAELARHVQKYLAASVKKGRQGNPAFNRPSQQPLPTGSRWLGAIPTLLHRRVTGMMTAVCPPTILPDPAFPSSPAELAPSAGSARSQSASGRARLAAELVLHRADTAVPQRGQHPPPLNLCRLQGSARAAGK